jgi:predicted unusual protein kinase regulating ubiquinone biosynthesis (AarF/ABC1/UbiB family)
LLTAEAIREEKILTSIKLKDLTFQEKSIGKGAYGQVQLATLPNGMKVAVKVIEK